MRDKDLIELAKKLGEEIDALPKDGKEHEISITVGDSDPRGRLGLEYRDRSFANHGSVSRFSLAARSSARRNGGAHAMAHEYPSSGRSAYSEMPSCN